MVPSGFRSGTSSSGEQPPDKRRRKDTNGSTSQGQNNDMVNNDDLWDDDPLELTTDQLKHIDEEIMLSQSQSLAVKNHKQTVPSVTVRPNVYGGRYSSSSAVPSKVGPTRTELLPFRSQQTGLSVPQRTKPKGFPRSMSSEFPKAQSTYPSVSVPCSGTQIIKGTRPAQGPDKMVLPSTGTNRVIGSEAASTGSESLKQENEGLKMANMTKEGEIKNLRRMLQETKEKLVLEGNKRAELLDQKSKDILEKEKQFEKEIQSLKTQIQFKDQDIETLQRDVRRKERQSSESQKQSASANCSREVEVSRSPLRSILVAKRDVQKSSPKTTCFGPSEKGFFSPISEERSSKSSSPKVIKNVDQQKGPALTEVAKKKRASLSGFDCRRGRARASQVVAKLTPSVCVPESENHYLLGLHSFIPQPSDPSGSRRDNINTMFDFSKTRKLIHNLATDVDPGKTLIECQQELSIHAVNELLDYHKIQGRNETCSCSPSTSSSLKPAVLIVPMLDAYLSRYLDMIQSSIDQGSSSSSGTQSYSSSSDFYSIDSVNTQVREKMLDYSNYAHLIERFAFNSVSLLYTLVENCEEVRQAVMEEKKDTTVPTQQAATNEGNKDITDVNENKSLTPCLIVDPLNEKTVMKDVHILTTLLHLANPNQRNLRQNAFSVIETVLRVLARLAEGCPGEQIFKFEPLLRQDIILTLLLGDVEWTSEQRLRCQLVLLRLITAMTRSPDTLHKLHTDSDECVLRATCSTILSPGHLSTQAKLKLGQKIIQLFVTIISLTHGGFAALLKANCQCDGDVPKAVIQLLYSALHEYRDHPSQDIQMLLCQGVRLLNQLSVNDKLFKIHKSHIQHQYVEEVIGLDALFKESSVIDISLEEAFQNLWDFDQEYPVEHGASANEAMDTL